MPICWGVYGEYNGSQSLPNGWSSRIDFEKYADCGKNHSSSFSNGNAYLLCPKGTWYDALKDYFKRLNVSYCEIEVETEGQQGLVIPDNPNRGNRSLAAELAVDMKAFNEVVNRPDLMEKDDVCEGYAKRAREIEGCTGPLIKPWAEKKRAERAAYRRFINEKAKKQRKGKK